MKTIIKYSLLILFFCAAVNASFASGAEDKYAFKFLESKLYNLKTEIWTYQIYKNEEPLRVMHVYVTDGFDGARILVDSDFNTSWNMYLYSKSRSVDNFTDSFRMQESTVNSLQEAVNLAVDHYIQDQIIKK